jgi:selenobiotic family peptide radical SAM maturase
LYSKFEATYRKIYTNCRRILGNQAWGRILQELDEESQPGFFADKLAILRHALALPDFIMDLARIEWALHKAGSEAVPDLSTIESVSVNPTLALLPVSWKNLVGIIHSTTKADSHIEKAAGIHILVWRHPKTGKLQLREAGDADLLALKIIVEKIKYDIAAAQGGVTVGVIESTIQQAVSQGILLSPASQIRRHALPKACVPPALESYLSADVFTLQWHITQACDLHCKHCYDRSNRTPVPYDAALAFLDDFYDFCSEMHVRGQISFTGGNPLLYPRFMDIYRAASERGFGIAILGNPSPMQQIEELVNIAKPLFFQVSLEGLQEHNDDIRGEGHFERSLEFLDQLRERDIYTMVMLTLSRDNMDQILPLAQILRERTDYFTFNRLSTVGEAARLAMADPKDFEAFLRDYEAAATDNPILGLKDNFINVILDEKNRPLFGGCTGYGCGAAFNFVALLPDGDIHACRKFPSPIGNMLQNRLSEIYHSELAQKYRTGAHSCRDCSLNIVCRGCLAVAHSYGLDVFKDRDPFCFITQEPYQ